MLSCYNKHIIIAEAGEPAGTTATPTSPGAGQLSASPQSGGGLFRRTFSFRRRERQDSASVATPAKEKEQQTHHKVNIQ